MTDPIVTMVTQRLESIDDQLREIGRKLDDKTERNGKQNMDIQQNASHIETLEKRGQWSVKTVALWMFAAAVIGAVFGNLDKIQALFK